MVVDGLIAWLAAVPAVRAMHLLDDLADQLTRPPRRAGSRSCGHPAGARWVGRGRFREAIAVGRLSCLPEEVGEANSS
jgi:hypothetical protein